MNTSKGPDVNQAESHKNKSDQSTSEAVSHIHTRPKRGKCCCTVYIGASKCYGGYGRPRGDLAPHFLTPNISATIMGTAVACLPAHCPPQGAHIMCSKRVRSTYNPTLTNEGTIGIERTWNIYLKASLRVSIVCMYQMW